MTDPTSALPSVPDAQQLDPTPQPSPTPDNATEPSPEAAARAASEALTDTFASSKVTFRVIESNLHADTHDPEVGEVVVPLKLKTKLVRKIMGQEGRSDMDQFFDLLDGLGDTRTIAKMDELDIMDTGAIVAKFFSEFTARQEAGRGESSGPRSS